MIRIGNCSGFYGDRISAVAEMLDGGELDYLTGDYLAELTMLILGRDRMKSPDLGYAKTFLRQMENSMGAALDKGVKIVVNAGGLNPAGLAQALRDLSGKLGVEARIAHVDGDDLIDRAAELGLGAPLTANAYLGGFGIARALDAGADIVVTGRVTDASLVVGPATSHFGWQPTDLDRLAGSVVAGHIIECGAQATGGNYSFFEEIADMTRLGFPIAEIAADGSSVITKHPGTGGAVTVGTVTAQLLYEIQGPRYFGPDVTTRIDSIRLAQQGADRVEITGVRGEAPPPDLKVSLNHLAGFRNEMTMVFTGLDIEAKAALAQRQLEALLTDRPADLIFRLVRTDQPDAPTQEQASALLHCVAKDTDPNKVGRQFSSAVVELALASYPGFTMTAPPGNGAPFGVFEPGYVAADKVEHRVTLPDGSVEIIPPSPARATLDEIADSASPAPDDWGPTTRIPLGTIAGARSGDKGGNANIGVWVTSDGRYRWLEQALTDDEIRRMLPETKDLTIHRYPLPNLRAINFVIEGILGRGVADNVRFDPQAKGLGEWLRSRHIDVPDSLLAQ
ncbi:acyclic terpene utilization AtuA family protein [Jongsikchunia kroppenstedtii]|uniref:acyclic terpene utilization AtuA family protein n=1 Tax=Jongsikchunia kroppenstedtii TaxID=1121721 RepID=UPI0005B8EC69|nr:acyclic terpene utilization AtuA family protein [Jongsikchunia kroppenstedtii]